MKSPVVGIDVGKYELVIYLNDDYHTVSNEESALKSWLKKYAAVLKKIDLIVFEPTGGYERTLKTCLEDNNLPYRRVHANHVRAYAKATGIAAKTDKIDAKILAEFAIRMEIKAKPEMQQYGALKALLTRREQLIGMRLQEKNRLETCEKLVGKWIAKNIEQLSKQIEQIEKAIDNEIDQDDGLKKLYQLYSSIPGVGKITSLQLIVDLPELLIEHDKTLAALVGLAPWNRDSGKMIGRRRTRGGRIRIRGLLYMAALVAARCNPELKAYYKKLKNKGKASKVALIAVAHKLLKILRSIAQRQTPWVAANE